MSYPQSLDEYTEAELRAEIERRRKARAERRCDYCNRPTSEPPCKFPNRHYAPDDEADV